MEYTIFMLYCASWEFILAYSSSLMTFSISISSLSLIIYEFLI